MDYEIRLRAGHKPPRFEWLPWWFRMKMPYALHRLDESSPLRSFVTVASTKREARHDARKDVQKRRQRDTYATDTPVERFEVPE